MSSASGRLILSYISVFYICC